jgi:hypothetical protein
MTLANVRRHWRFLATVLVILCVLATVPAVLIYGLGPLMATVAERFGDESILVFGLVFAAATLGWLFFVLWAGDKADRMSLGAAASDTKGDGNG